MTEHALFGRIELNILRSLGLAIPYGYIEQGFYAHGGSGFTGHYYRIALLLMQILHFANQKKWLWLADSVFNITVQDAFYWIFAWKVPNQWAWYYPVWHGFPLTYLFGAPLTVYAYWKVKHGKRQ